MTDAIQKAREALRAIIDTLDAEEMGEGPPASEHVAHWQKLHDDGTAALAALDAETEVKVRAPVRWPSAGDKMRFRAENGYDHELAAAKAIFQKGDVVTVRKCNVGSFSHTIWFEGHEQGFNGVMFELLPPEPRS